MKNFEKWQGCGNDFIIIDSRLDGQIDSAEKISKLCDRHFGIGADGVIYVLNSNVAEVRMRIFNADGSEAEMCGNGIRCFTKFLLDSSDKNNLTVETGAGILKMNLRGELVTVNQFSTLKKFQSSVTEIIALSMNQSKLTAKLSR